MSEKRVFALTACIAIAGLAGGIAWAADPIARVDIPFDFSLAETTMEAGTYELMLDGQNRDALILRNERSGEFVRPEIVARVDEGTIDEPTLVFDDVETAHRLTLIHVPGMESFVLQPTPAEMGYDEMRGTR